MQSEPPAIRALWVALFVAAVGVLLFTLLRGPTSGSRGMASGPHLTFWVADAQADPQSDQLAAQVSSYWQLNPETGTVGLLPGKPAQAINTFLRRTATSQQAPGNLLVLTSTTMSALDGHPAAGLAARAPVVTVLATDPLELAVKTGSRLRSLPQALALVRTNPSRKVFGVANDNWLLGNLAALVPGQQLHGRSPYTLFASSADAIAGLENRSAQVVLAPRSALTGALAAHRVRLLRWPHGRPPQAWMALVAPFGLTSGQVAQLRRRARQLTLNSRWRAMLRRDGLHPETMPSAALDAFLRAQLADARRLQALIAQFVQG